MIKLINQAITQAKLAQENDRAMLKSIKLTQEEIDTFVNHHQTLLTTLRKLRTKIAEPKPEPPHRYPEADEKDQLGGWQLSQEFTKEIGAELSKKYPFPLPLSVVEDVLLIAEKNYPLAQAAAKPLNLAEHEFTPDQLIERVMKNMTRPPKGQAQIQRWAMVKQTFAVGSSVACTLCHHYQLNPDDVIR